MWNREIIKLIVQRIYCNLRIQAAAAGAVACVWWGILYPELCFTDSTYEQVIVDDEEVDAEPENFRNILDASGDDIVIKSRLLEWIVQRIDKH